MSLQSSKKGFHPYWKDVCELCGRKFPSHRKLTKHIKVIHPRQIVGQLSRDLKAVSQDHQSKEQMLDIEEPEVIEFLDADFPVSEPESSIPEDVARREVGESAGTPFNPPAGDAGSVVVSPKPDSGSPSGGLNSPGHLPNDLVSSPKQKVCSPVMVNQPVNSPNFQNSPVGSPKTGYLTSPNTEDASKVEVRPSTPLGEVEYSNESEEQTLIDLGFYPKLPMSTADNLHLLDESLSSGKKLNYGLIEGPVAPNPGEVYDFIGNDPRLYFINAPSSIIDSPAAAILKAQRLTAKKCNNRKYSTILAPPEINKIRKIESCEFPDGTIYQIQTVYYKDSK